MVNCGEEHTATRRYGFIEAFNGDMAIVRLRRISACSSCESSGNCRSHAGKEILVEVKCNKDSCHKVGDGVYVEISRGSALKAVGIGFLTPMTLILLSVVIVKYFGGDDLLSAYSSLVVIALYFVFIHTIRHKMDEVFGARLLD